MRGDVRVERRRFGDEHHAVHAYPREHYAHWERELGSAPGTYTPGHFGENLTIEGALETSVRIGDVLRCGSAVLQIAQPRIPCRKLSARMGVKGFARTFLASRRVGYYLRVLEVGDVAAGDALELLDRDLASPTVDELVRVTNERYWDAAALEEMLAARDLPPAWREMIGDKLARARDARGWAGLRDLEVSERVDECADVISIRLRCAVGQPLAPFHAGQTITLVLSSAEHRNVRRAYAISSDPRDTSSYRITVARKGAPSADLPEGVVSTLLHRTLEVGDVVRCTAPAGHFGNDLPEDDVLFVSVGIGIAPIAAMLHAWPEAGSATHVHFDRNGEAHALRDELTRVAASRKIQMCAVYSDPQAYEQLGRDYDLRGRLGDGALARIVGARSFRGGALVAGPTALVERAVEELVGAGTDRSRVRAECFGA
jgi:MOSC domain-containing protein YiiM/ferredoxin-NADP reductase